MSCLLAIIYKEAIAVDVISPVHIYDKIREGELNDQDKRIQEKDRLLDSYGSLY